MNNIQQPINKFKQPVPLYFKNRNNPLIVSMPNNRPIVQVIRSP